MKCCMKCDNSKLRTMIVPLSDNNKTQDKVHRASSNEASDRKASVQDHYGQSEQSHTRNMKGLVATRQRKKE